MTPLEIAVQLFAQLQLEIPQSAQFVPGGLQHRLLKVETAREKFALKIFAPCSTATVEGRARLERAENVAQIAARNAIPALVALASPNGDFLSRVGADWVALYPWKKGETLPPVAADLGKCAQMGALLGRLHALKIRFDDQNAPVPEAFEGGHFRGLENRARTQNKSWAPRLEAALDDLEAANALAMSAQNQLRENYVTGHLDFDQKNVLWNENQPTILDWEAAKPIHPALEALGAALSWAGQSAGEPEFASFAAFLRAYRGENEVQNADLQRAVDGVLGKWLIWLEWNLQRLLESEIEGAGEEKIAFDAAFHALEATLKLRKDGAKYRDWLAQI